MEQVFEELSEKVFVGDSAKVDLNDRKTFEDFLKSLKEVKYYILIFLLAHATDSSLGEECRAAIHADCR